VRSRRILTYAAWFALLLAPVAMDAMNFVLAQSQGDAAALVLEHAEDPANLRDELLEGGR